MGAIGAVSITPKLRGPEALDGAGVADGLKIGDVPTGALVEFEVPDQLPNPTDLYFRISSRSVFAQREVSENGVIAVIDPIPVLHRLDACARSARIEHLLDLAEGDPTRGAQVRETRRR